MYVLLSPQKIISNSNDQRIEKNTSYVQISSCCQFSFEIL